ncbi:MAG: hypothetical protein WDM79_19210 [Terricaulis sp.]
MQSRAATPALFIIAASAAAALLVIASAPAAHAQGAGGGHGKAHFIASYDDNGDGVVSRAEYDAERGAQFSRTNEDGANDVSETEYVAEYTVRLEQELAATRQSQIAQAHVRFGALDADHDGRVSRAEFDASGERMFTRLDSNQDGAVNAADTAESY